jgi:hypothetical protein
LISLHVNLTKESEVEMILKRLPQLKYLNGLDVDREELELDDDTNQDEQNEMIDNEDD